MKRCLLVVLVLLVLGIPAWGDTVIAVTLSPGVQNLPVSTSASLTIGWDLTQQPPTGDYTGTVLLEYQILSGPDAGPVVTSCCGTYTFSASDFDNPNSRSFSFTNDGTAGTDVVEASLVDTVSSLTFTSNTVTVNWPAPEPASLGLLLAGLSAIALCWRRRTPQARP